MFAYVCNVIRKNMKARVFTVFCDLLAAAAIIGCNANDEVLKPMAGHVIGRWEQTLSETLKEKMGFSENHSLNYDGTPMEGDGFRWIYTRIDDESETLSEKLLGRWRFLESYVKKDGQWRPTVLSHL